MWVHGADQVILTNGLLQAAMNALHPLAVYAAVQAHKGEPLHYPGDIEAW